MRKLVWLSLLVAACGSGSNGDDAGKTGNSSCGLFCGADGGLNTGCVGLACAQATCSGTATTTLTGTVYDPAGKVPLYNATVYVPNGAVAKLTSGLGDTCDRCDAAISGEPLTLTTTNARGEFTLANVPAGIDYPLVVQVGKWRRQVTIPKMDACTTASADPSLTRLPRNRVEGDIPRIALSTGSADPLECLLRKIGVEDSEFGVSGSDARIHLYAGGRTAPANATTSFASGTAFPGATSLWSTLDAMKPYDIVLLSCEGGENPDDKPTPARQALYDYAKLGGRVFTSHFHHYWFSSSPVAEVKSIADWTNDYTCTGPSCTYPAEPLVQTIVDATINTSFPKGAAMHDWLANTGSLTGAGGTLPIQEARENITAVHENALSWMTIANPAAGGATAHEYVSFNTPVGASDADVCGRVVYTDLHVGAGDATGTPFPNGCTTADLTPQQKALEFMLFDLSSCIQKDDLPPVAVK